MELIRYIIEFCADNNESISHWAESSESWTILYNCSFTKPSTKQINEIREALENFASFISARDKEFIEFCIRILLNVIYLKTTFKQKQMLSFFIFLT